MSTTAAFLHLDTTAYINYFAGLDRETAVRLYTKMARSFLANIDTKLEFLTQALTHGKTNDARVMAHQLKGSLLAIGGTKLAADFLRIEKEVENTSPAPLLSLLNERKKDFPIFREELARWVETLQLRD